MVAVYHLPFDRPLSQLREYIQVLRPLLETGEVHFAGEFYEVDATIPRPVDTTLLIAALRPPAFELAGSLADGAISWNCPVSYLLETSKRRSSVARRRLAARRRRSSPMCRW